MPETEVLSKNVRKIRKALKQNQFEFAENCGISVETLSLIERKKADPRLSTIQKIAAYTDTFVSELVELNFREYNMKCTYKIREDLIKDEYGNDIKVYGMDVFRLVCMENKLILSIPDIYTDFNKIQHLVSLCNKSGVSFGHIMDIIEDSL